jgi:hypothetical protein
MPKTTGSAKTKKTKAINKATKSRAQAPRPAPAFSVLEKSILLSKGASETEIGAMIKSGIRCREDFRSVGDAGTLAALSGMSPGIATKVMSWALGLESVVVESGDVVRCVHCGTKQPKDYKSGDLCGSCGKQAEPIMACFWCGSTGPGKFCRHCGAEFVPTGELELALLLKREGLPKQDIPEKLRGMNQAEKDVLWGRARRY